MPTNLQTYRHFETKVAKVTAPSMIDAVEIARASYSEVPQLSFDMDRRQLETLSCSPGDNRSFWARKVPAWSSLGFFAVLYSSPSGNQVLAFRGTDDLLGDLMSDLIDDTAIFFGAVPPTAIRAMELPGSLDRNNLWLTGHSLGGALAILAAAKWALPTVTFNAPGVMDSCVRSAFLPSQETKLWNFINRIRRCVAGSRVHNVRIKGDPISSFFATGLQSGGSLNLGTSQCKVYESICRHGIDTCVSEVRSQPQGYDPIDI